MCLEENGHVYYNDLFETYDWNIDPMTNPDLLNQYMATLNPDPDDLELDETHGGLVMDDEDDDLPYDPEHDENVYIDLFEDDGGLTADAQSMLHKEDTNGDFV